MLILLKKFSLPILFGFSVLTYANELVEVNMESVLEVGRENQELSATSQDKIDLTERQTDKLVNEFKVVQNKLKDSSYITRKKEFKFRPS